MITYTLSNDYHGTETVVRSDSRALTATQVTAARRTLCGIDGCQCAEDAAGTRGGAWRVEQANGEGTRFDLVSLRRGGVREGAGRPPIHGETTRNVSLTLPPSLVDRLDEYAAERGLSRSRALVGLIEPVLP